MAFTDSAVFTISTSAGVPAWFSALAHKQFATPVTNWLGDAAVRDPRYNVQNNVGTSGHPGIIEAYCGMGADQSARSIWMAGNGGHADYAGNEVYSCDLGVPAPAWQRRRNASVAPANDQTVWRIFPDGTPPSDHTGNYQVAAQGRWYKGGLGSPNWLGSPAGDRGWSFNPSNNTWRDDGNMWLADINAITGCLLYDSVDDQLIKITPQGSPAVQYVNRATMATALTAGNNIGSSSVVSAAIDPVRRKLIFRTGSDFTSFAFVIDLNNKAAGWTSIPMTGTAPGSGPNDARTNMFYWHSPSNAFLSWDTNNGLMKLTPNVTGSTYNSVAWSNVGGVTGATPVMPASVSGGMWSRVNMINDMGNGNAALVVVPRYGFPDVYVMRLTGAV